jgi:hypothetical protein
LNVKDLINPPALVRAADLETATLATLANEIRHEHASAEAAAAKAIDHARRAGELLQRAKAQVGHGKWLNWVSRRCGFSDRTARVYMRVARRWEELEAKRQTSANLSVKDALRLLAEPAPSEEAFLDRPEHHDQADGRYGRVGCPYRPIFLDTPEARHKLCAQWRDIKDKYVVLLDAVGWDVGRIAEFLGGPPEQISLTLDPRPPVRFTHEWEGSELLTLEGQRLYQDAVAGEIAHSRAWTYFRAASAASCEEEFVSVRGQMEHLHQYYLRQSQRLDPCRLLHCEWDLILPLCCCVIKDARAALGIEPAEEWLVLMLFRFERETREAQGGDPDQPDGLAAPSPSPPAADAT